MIVVIRGMKLGKIHIIQEGEDFAVVRDKDGYILFIIWEDGTVNISQNAYEQPKLSTWGYSVTRKKGKL